MFKQGHTISETETPQSAFTDLLHQLHRSTYVQCTLHTSSRPRATMTGWLVSSIRIPWRLVVCGVLFSLVGARTTRTCTHTYALSCTFVFAYTHVTSPKCTIGQGQGYDEIVSLNVDVFGHGSRFLLANSTQFRLTINVCK